MVDIEIERITVDVILAEQLGVIGLIDRGLEPFALTDELAAHIDVAGAAIHCAAGDQAAFDEQMRIVPHDLAILAGAGLGLVRIDDQIVRPVSDRLGHERPLQSGWEAGAAAAAQARGLHLVDDRVAAFVQDRLGAVPGTTLARALKAPVVEAVEIPEDAVLVVEHQAFTVFSVVGPPTGADNCRSICGPGLTCLPFLKPSRTFSKLSAVRSS